MSSFKIEPRQWTLIAALAIAIYACYELIAPYISAIVLAFIISLLYYPLHQQIEQKLQRYPNLSAGLSCVILTVIIIIPFLFVSVAILRQGLTSFGSAYDWLTHGGAEEILSTPVIQSSLKYLNQILPPDTFEPQDILTKVASTISSLSSTMLGISSNILGNITEVLINFLLMLFVLFFLLRDHDSIIQTIRHVTPLSRNQEDTLLDEIQKVAKSAVLGAFLTAFAQGFVGGVAMWMAGFAGLFWGTIMAFASFIPIVGTALIWIPAAGYLTLIGQWEWAVFLIVWGVAVIGSIDNLLRPFLMKGNSGMNTLLIFFSLIGGLQVYGMMGIIYGPIIFSLTLVLFRMYETEFHNFLLHQDNN